MIQNSSVNALNAINDYLKIEYPEGMRNEFNTMDSLINFLSKDELQGKYKEKLFALGIVDNMRALGDMWDKSTFSSNQTDKYEIGLDDYEKLSGAENVTARFDVTKFMNTFSVTDEALLIGTTDGSLYDTVRDNLNRMNTGLKHTQQRMAYGGKNGIIGKITNKEDTISVSGKPVIKVVATNGNSIMGGMQLMLRHDSNKWLQGKVWQKVPKLKADPELFIIVDEFSSALDDGGSFKDTAFNPDNDEYKVYSRQFRAQSGVKREYQGLNDILIDPPTTLFNVNMDEYPSLKSEVKDLNGDLVTEQVLDEMHDHIMQNNSDDTSIDMVVSSYPIISTITQQFYSFKQYDIDTSSEEFNMGRRGVNYAGYKFHKDKYSRDDNVYLIDTNMIHELLRKDFGWLTDGREDILERRDGTEIYEAIMTKYADFAIDGWRAHAAFTNAANAAIT